MSNPEKEVSKSTSIDTDGGASIGHDVNAGHDVAGRDINITNNYSSGPVETDKKGCSRQFQLTIKVSILSLSVIFIANLFIWGHRTVRRAHYPPETTSKWTNNIALNLLAFIILFIFFYYLLSRRADSSRTSSDRVPTILDNW